MKLAILCWTMFLLAWCQLCEAQTEYTFHSVGFESSAIDLAGDGTLLFSSPYDSNPRKYFVRDPKGSIQELEFPDDTYSPTGINSHGTIVGNRYPPGTVFAPNVFHFPIEAFLRSPDGEITEFRIPNATRTIAHDINDRGDIVGGYRVSPLDADWAYGFVNVDLGYVHNKDTGETETFADSDGALQVTAITEQGRMIGSFEEYIDVTGGYVQPKDHPLHDSQGQSPPECERGGLLWFDFNDADQTALLCTFSYATFVPIITNSSFVYDGEMHKSIAYPGANGTSVTSINNDGMLAGTVFYGDETLSGQRSGYAFVATVPEPWCGSVWPSVALLLLCMRSCRRGR